MSEEQQIIDEQYLLRHESSEVRADFYKKTYAHVAGAFLVFLVLEIMLMSSPAVRELSLRMMEGYTWLIVLGLFMFATNYAEKTIARSTDIRGQYLGFFIYILAEAIIFVPLLTLAILITGNTDVLVQAFGVTVALFAGISGVVFITKKDFSFLRSAIMIGSFIALGLIVVGMIFGFNLGLWFSVGMVVLAGASILYQTSNLIHKYEKDDYVIASLGLFASFMLLLWYIIQIFLSRD
jgi:FtsH-binding integral membrane protein